MQQKGEVRVLAHRARRAAAIMNRALSVRPSVCLQMDGLDGDARIIGSLPNANDRGHIDPKRNGKGTNRHDTGNLICPLSCTRYFSSVATAVTG